MKQLEILLVEDNETDAELAIRALKKHDPSVQITHIIDGPEALDFIFARGNHAKRDATDFPSLILLDLKLPKLNGLEVLKTIKQHPSSKIIPVIMLTSSKQQPDVEMAYEYGANSYIVKPVDFEKFTDALKAIGYYWTIINQLPILK